MVENWLNSYLEELSLENSLDANDFLGLANFAHQLKGASGSLLIEPVFDLALAIENASKASDKKECEFQIGLLKKINI